MESFNKLVDCCLDGWSESDASALSARSVSRAAGVAISAIYHHFGSMDRLFYVAHERALLSAGNWCETRLRELGNGNLAGLSFAPLLAGLIDDWCRDQRQAAFAWRECRIAASHNPFYLPIIRGWAELWGNFWSTFCDRMGCGQHAQPTARFFQGESFFHLLSWRRPIDRAALEETCAGWQAWLNGQLSPATPWRDFARADALQALPTFDQGDPVMVRLSGVAADLVSARGTSALTHRALASESGMSLGSVSNKLRTRADLLRAAFEALYLRNVKEEGLGQLTTKPAKELMQLAADGAFGDLDQVRGSDELIMACARDSAFEAFGAQLRYLRGRSGRHLLTGLVGKPVSNTDAAIFSSFMMGVMGAHMHVTARDVRILAGKTDLEALFQMLLPHETILRP
ncbi:TetR/AcrR family transcriptional regulator [Sphingomonas crocodyli]|uniref:TetR/AcrR family transcriptional regulator n=1 Tax=Sphingomonas crocodyli TaxID=1979270 RepID=A0A437M0D4_9SPHN|nr:TetR/AcrR family transcriptional regulator [Sphingomonas crocodyli]RVT91082.1 TetR/AcrR family transcriptional regulator [Sphingomonas crocodyli]